jgi:omega-6 fatty acid desaturase (delta-12 desaturase)
MRKVLDQYSRPDTSKAIWQLVNTVVPCLALWILMFFTLRVSYWLTLGIAVVTAAFLVRTFIIFHDCGHGSFLPSRLANRMVGFFTGVLTLTPHHYWWADHARHHATSGNLDRRGVGDIWMMTVEEYEQSSWRTRLWYRVYRHPVLMFLFGPFLVFGVVHRIPRPGTQRREVLSVIWTNLALASIWTTLALTVGIKSYLMIHVPVLLFSGVAGLWLFYVQHTYQFAYWRRTADHDFMDAALIGSSYFELPRVLQWFSGNIGFHHIHHLSPRIPNYFLERCHRRLPEMPDLARLSLRTSLRSLSLRVWDESDESLISFGEWKRRKRHEGSRVPSV